MIMLKKFTCITVAAVFMLVLTSCMYENGDTSPIGQEIDERQLITEEEARERLLEMGWEEGFLDAIASDDVGLINIYNQSRFSEYAQELYSGRAIGASGEVIAPQYFGGLKFDDMGFLVVSVLPAGFNHAPTATAIAEMREKGIIIRQVEFTQQEITATIGRLNDMFENARAAGASSWGQGADNGISIWLDPYNDEQKAIFNDFLIGNGFDPSIFIIQPAVTQEMLDWRVEHIATATASPGDRIILVGEVEVSRTGIAFSLKNTTDMEFIYGSPWDLAVFENDRWLPVPHLPGAGSTVWTAIGMSLQGGGIQQYRQSFEWHFGALPPGRYMFIRGGWQGQWNPDQPGVYALVEFKITANTPMELPPAPEPEWPIYVEVVEINNVTSTGMNIVVENVSPYGIQHRAQIIFIIPAEHATAHEPWTWPWEYHLPFLSFDDMMQGHGFIPAGETREFEIYLGNLFGELPPGDYKLDLSIGGEADPPHPTGWAFGSALIEFTVEP